jgi:HTH-type transcriptional regulator / antitoxin HipB
MDDQRVGAAIRSVRIRRGLRQSDLARLAGGSRATISRVERGHLASLTVETLRRITAVLDIRLDVVARWRGGDLDRLVNSRHSALHEQVARRFSALGEWLVMPEVSFAIYGERGIVDILAFHRQRQMLLVIELKSEIVDVNELIGTLDRKRRLCMQIAHEEGWPVSTEVRVSAWVIVSDTSTNRHRLAAHRAMLRAAFPTDGRAMPGWLRQPDRVVRALSFWPNAHPWNAKPGAKRVRRPVAAVGDESDVWSRTNQPPRGSS